MNKFNLFAFFSITLIFPRTAFAQLSARQERNLTAFTKLYGYVRHFYPGDEAQQINWDLMAIYGSGQVLNQPDDPALVASLNKLFLPIASAIQIAEGSKPLVLNKSLITPLRCGNYQVVAWQHEGYGIGGGYRGMRINRRDLQQSDQENGNIPFIKVDLRKYPGQSFLLISRVKTPKHTDGINLVEFRDNFIPHYIPHLKIHAITSITDTATHVYRITDSLGAGVKTLAIGFAPGSSTSLQVSFHLYVYNNGKQTEVPLNFAHTASLTGDDSIRRYALVINNIHNPDKPLFTQHAKIGESIHTSLVSGIQCLVPLALYGDVEGTYPVSATPEDLKQLVQQIEQVQADPASLYTRLGDVGIIWNVFQHFFPYWDDASKNPQLVLHNALTKAFTDKNAVDFFYTTKLICAALNDGHMFYNPAGIDDASAPVVLAKAEGKIVIKWVLDPAFKSTIHAGDVVESIDGQDALEALQQKIQYQSGSPQCRERDALTYLAWGKKNDPLRLVLNHEGKKNKVNIDRNQPAGGYRPGNFSLNPTPDGLLKDGIYYYNLSGNSVVANIQHQLPQILKAKAIILDMRCYPAANLAPLVTQFLTHTDNSHWLFRPEIIYPDHQQTTYRHADWHLRPTGPHIDTRVYYLIDESTQSAAESISGYFKDFKLATLIGRPTAGANGNVAEFRVPGMSNMSFSGMLVTNHDGSKEHVAGIIPDITVLPTIKGIGESRDEVLERAIAEAEKGK